MPAGIPHDLTDVHFHPTDFPQTTPLGQIMERARLAGVRKTLASGFSPQTCMDVERLARMIPGMACTVGYHPWFLGPELDLGLVRELARSPAVIAIGEIGLDGRCDVDRTLQENWFSQQLELAQSLNLPVVIHSRQAVEWVLGVLRQFPNSRGLLHSFPGAGEAVRPFLDLGFYVSVSGAVTRSNARKVLSLLHYLPLDRLLLETNAPAILIEGVPRGEVEPCHLTHVLDAVACHLKMPAQQVAEQTERNVCTLFGTRFASAAAIFDPDWTCDSK